jgi:hypothetical protein
MGGMFGSVHGPLVRVTSWRDESTVTRAGGGLSGGQGRGAVLSPHTIVVRATALNSSIRISWLAFGEGRVFPGAKLLGAPAGKSRRWAVRENGLTQKVRLVYLPGVLAVTMHEC